MRSSKSSGVVRKGGRVEGLNPSQTFRAEMVARRIRLFVMARGARTVSSFEKSAVEAGHRHIRRADLYPIISGLRAPTTKVLIRIADALGEDVFQLLVCPELSPRQALVDRLRHAPPRTIRRLNKVIDEEDLPLG
jgi:hypothetical protein